MVSLIVIDFPLLRHTSVVNALAIARILRFACDEISIDLSRQVMEQTSETSTLHTFSTVV
ncbi:MAG: hypothetical protein AB7G24_02150 [Novosphingobium sp.]